MTDGDGDQPEIPAIDDVTVEDWRAAVQEQGLPPEPTS